MLLNALGYPNVAMEVEESPGTDLNSAPLFTELVIEFIVRTGVKLEDEGFLTGVINQNISPPSDVRDPDTRPHSRTHSLTAEFQPVMYPASSWRVCCHHPRDAEALPFASSRKLYGASL